MTIVPEEELEGDVENMSRVNNIIYFFYCFHYFVVLSNPAFSVYTVLKCVLVLHEGQL